MRILGAIILPKPLLMRPCHNLTIEIGSPSSANTSFHSLGSNLPDPRRGREGLEYGAEETTTPRIPNGAFPPRADLQHGYQASDFIH